MKFNNTRAHTYMPFTGGSGVRVERNFRHRRNIARGFEEYIIILVRTEPTRNVYIFLCVYAFFYTIFILYFTRLITFNFSRVNSTRSFEVWLQRVGKKCVCINRGSRAGVPVSKYNTVWSLCDHTILLLPVKISLGNVHTLSAVRFSQDIPIPGVRGWDLTRLPTVTSRRLAYVINYDSSEKYVLLSCCYNTRARMQVWKSVSSYRPPENMYCAISSVVIAFRKPETRVQISTCVRSNRVVFW